MDTKIIKILGNKEDVSNFKLAGEILRNGGLVGFPTETVYGLGANGLDEEAVKKIYKAKGRPSDNPLILHISEKEDLNELISDLPKEAEICMDRFWPGPLTMIFKKSDIVPDIITGGLDTVAVRMPNHEIARSIIREAKKPIAAPSANTSGRPSPTRASHVIEDMDGRIDMIIDGGNTGIGLESTVLDLSGECPMVLRPGKITLEDLKEVLPNVIQDKSIVKSDIVPKSPGQKYKHYAPKADMTLFSGDIDKVIDRINDLVSEYNIQGKRVGILGTNENKDRYSKDAEFISLGDKSNPDMIGQNLFDSLRKFDNKNVDIILSESFDYSELGMAIMNRMKKAAGGKIVNI